MTTIVETPKGITAFHMLAQYHAAELELKGLKHSSGRSIILHIKRIYGFSGNKESVVEQFHQMLIDRGITS